MILLWYFLFCQRWKWCYNLKDLASLLAIARVAKSQFSISGSQVLFEVSLGKNMFTIKPTVYDLPREHSLKTGGCLIQV